MSLSIMEIGRLRQALPWKRPVFDPLAGAEEGGAVIERVEPHTLHVHDLTVRFGGVVAVDHLTLDVARPGPITVRVRYTAFWSVTTGTACVASAPGGWTAVDAQSVGVLELSASVLHSSPPAYCSTP